MNSRSRIDYTTASDSVLVIALGRADEAAMQEIFSRHAGPVFGLAKRVLNDPSRAEEVMQEILLKLWHQPQRFDPERGSLRTFLLRETHSKSVDVIRSDRRREAREDRTQYPISASTDDLEREVWDYIVADKVRASLDQLTPDERDAIVLAYFGGHTYREVAAMLCVPEGTVKGRIRAGLHRLKGALASSGIEP